MRGPATDARGTAQFDRALSALLDELSERALLDDTLVVATGEFGRTPRLNDAGGRDHWTHTWSALVAGGGTPGGMVVGTTDARGQSPLDRPIHPSDLHATLLNHFSLPTSAREEQAADFAAVTAQPIAELACRA